MLKKTHVYIDGANLYMRTKANGMSIDMQRFFIYLKQKFKTDNIYYFIGYKKSNESIFNFLSTIGYKMVFRESVQGRFVKGNCDSEMTLFIAKDLFVKNVSDFILVTSDGDFACVVKEIQDNDKFCKVISPTDSYHTSNLLKTRAKNITFIKDIYSLIKGETPDMDKTIQGVFL